MLCHAGFLYGVRDPSVLLNAIAKANRLIKHLDKQIVFLQIGKVELNYDIKSRYREMIEKNQLIIEEPKPYRQCLLKLKQADWLVNIQPGTKTQVPSKLYDYLALNRPILNITEKSGALGELVTEYQFGKLFDFDEEDAIAEWLQNTMMNSDLDTFFGYEHSDQFNSKNITKVLVDKIIKNCLAAH